MPLLTMLLIKLCRFHLSVVSVRNLQLLAVCHTCKDDLAGNWNLSKGTDAFTVVYEDRIIPSGELPDQHRDIQSGPDTLRQ